MMKKVDVGCPFEKPREALKQLQHMPFIVETPSAQRKKLALEDKLKEIEDAVALFSRTKVFVKVEDYKY